VSGPAGDPVAEALRELRREYHAESPARVAELRRVLALLDEAVGQCEDEPLPDAGTALDGSSSPSCSGVSTRSSISGAGSMTLRADGREDFAAGSAGNDAAGRICVDVDAVCGSAGCRAICTAS